MIASVCHSRSQTYDLLLEELGHHLDPWYASYVLEDIVHQMRLTSAGIDRRHICAIVMEWLPRYLDHVPGETSRWVCHRVWLAMGERVRTSSWPPAPS